MTETTFTLIRTIKSRGGGDDDYDVCDGDKVIGRIVRSVVVSMCDSFKHFAADHRSTDQAECSFPHPALCAVVEVR
jgi:hypothetical protein